MGGGPRGEFASARALALNPPLPPVGALGLGAGLAFLPLACAGPARRRGGGSLCLLGPIAGVACRPQRAAAGDLCPPPTVSPALAPL